MRVHVVIATAGARPPLLRRTLGSIAAAERPAALASVFVVENGGAGGSESVVSAFAGVLPVRYVGVREAGKSRALNRVLAEAGDGLAVMLDDDVRVAPEVLGAYASAAASADASTSYFGGPVGADYEEAPPEYLRPCLPFSARGWEPPPGRAGAGDLLFLGFNWAADVRLLLDAGGFREDLGPGTPARIGDENDMQLRLQARGARSVYLPEARVWHWVPRERCAKEWVVERGFLSGRSRAHEMRNPGLSVGGCPLWVVRRCVTTALRSAVARGEASRFRCRFGQSVNRGLLAGFRERRNAPRGGAARAPASGGRA